MGRHRHHHDRRRRGYSRYGYYGNDVSLLGNRSSGTDRRTASTYGPPRTRDPAWRRHLRRRMMEYDRKRREKLIKLREAEEERRNRNRLNAERREREREMREKMEREEKEERERENRRERRNAEEERREKERREKEEKEREKLEALRRAEEEKREREEKKKEEEARRERERIEREIKEEEERLRREMEEREKREKEARERAEREARERANKRPLSVTDIDYHIKDNTERHHTDKYELTTLKKGAELVVRRGQGFLLTITFDRPYNIEKHDLRISFFLGENAKVSNNTLEVMILNEDGKDAIAPNAWHAKLIRRHGNSIDVEIRPACNCIIGEWEYAVETRAQGATEQLYDIYLPGEDINIILNPWCEADDVYMKDTDLLKEYCLNDQGVVFTGSDRYPSGKAWNFGQFENGILEICFDLLRRGNNGEYTMAMSDPIKISRMISKIVSSNDDNGVLVGKWGGGYKDGTSPSTWVGSVKILQQYDESGPVKYGQCWVFSGVTTTVCRALGLPCKSVTCYSSAHDTDETASIAKVYDITEDGGVELNESLTNDSIWNFHVWNEVFMKRWDLLEEKYFGWQVIDATPQETSEGVFQCGPAPVKAIKNGHCKLPYDTRFIFAEVNADVKHWHVKGRHWSLSKVEKDRVGTLVVSKSPDGVMYDKDLTIAYRKKYEFDVTDHYKYPEGSKEERIAVHNAESTSRRVSERVAVEEVPEVVVLSMNPIDSVNTGEDFTVDFHIQNITDKPVSLSNIKMTLVTKRYTGDTVATVLTRTISSLKLGPHQEEVLVTKVSTDAYLPKLVEQGNLEARLTLQDAETEHYMMATEKFRLRRPDIDIKLNSDKVKLGKSFKATLSFKNLLPIPLTSCKLSLEGAGFFGQKGIDLDDVKKNSEWTYAVEMIPKRRGHEQFLVSFDCEELPDIMGKAEVYVT